MISADRNDYLSRSRKTAVAVVRDDEAADRGLILGLLIILPIVGVGLGLILGL